MFGNENICENEKEAGSIFPFHKIQFLREFTYSSHLWGKTGSLTCKRTFKDTCLHVYNNDFLFACCGKHTMFFWLFCFLLCFFLVKIIQCSSVIWIDKLQLKWYKYELEEGEELKLGPMNSYYLCRKPWTNSAFMRITEFRWLYGGTRLLVILRETSFSMCKDNDKIRECCFQ